ncbi:MAG: AAA family ATPase [Alloprevotella sp.]|nr:AAA family ATPase [Alloprevotella sp.]
MKFLERSKPLKELKELQQKAEQGCQVAVVSGRKGTGKTTLVLQATKDVPTIYFYVSRRAESLLCRDLIAEVHRAIGLSINEETIELRNIFKQLITESHTRRFNLIIDEVHEFVAVNPTILPDLQAILERNRERSKLCLIMVGSSRGAMEKIFGIPHAPFFNKTDLILELKPYSLDTLKRVMDKYLPEYTADDLITLYGCTGGVPQYVGDLIDAGALKRKEIVRYIFRKGSPYLTLGKDLLIDEVGKEYTFYFSILSCIASGITSRSAIEELLNKEIGGYLTRMENDFHLIQKRTPLYSKSGSKNVRYIIEDKFLRCWFRYVYPHAKYVETGDFKSLERIVIADHYLFAEEVLHSYFHQLVCEEGTYDIIGGWWENTTENHIDLIAVNTAEKKGIVANFTPKYSAEAQEAFDSCKSVLQDDLDGYEVDYRVLTLADL